MSCQEGKEKKNRGSYPITSRQTQKAVHKLRADNDAILVGRRTVDVDNPSLSVRFAEGNNPTRLIIDPRLELDYSSLKMIREKGETWVLCCEGKLKEIGERLEIENIKILPWLEMKIVNWLEKLRSVGIHSILVEGGAFTLQKFLDADCYDDIDIFISDKELGGGLKAPELPDIVSVKFKETHVGEDKMKLYIRKC